MCLFLLVECWLPSAQTIAVAGRTAGRAEGGRPRGSDLSVQERGGRREVDLCRAPDANLYVDGLGVGDAWRGGRSGIIKDGSAVKGTVVTTVGLCPMQEGGTLVAAFGREHRAPVC